MIGVGVIVLALAALVYLAYRGASLLLLAPAMAVFAVLASEGGHDQAAVLRQHPAAERAGLGGGLEGGVFGEGRPRLLDLDRPWQRSQRFAAEPERGQQVDQFAYLAGVGGAEHEGVGHALAGREERTAATRSVAGASYRLPAGRRGTSIGFGCTSSRTPPKARGITWPRARE